MFASVFTVAKDFSDYGSVSEVSISHNPEFSARAENSGLWLIDTSDTLP